MGLPYPYDQGFTLSLVTGTISGECRLHAHRPVTRRVAGRYELSRRR
ncbi:MAG: hypothetical protein KatS3mg110_3337 [Pirellulaceae bacterium]|nr:MAG: hypothetical protein KatS3mg110_3337 [Pirellulaceae bacterium]